MIKTLLLHLKPEIYNKINHPIGVRPPYTLKYIESLLLDASFSDTQLIDQRIRSLDLSDIVKIVDKIKPDVIIIDVTTINQTTSLQLADIIRKKNNTLLLIAIGQEVSANPDQFMKIHNAFDAAFSGESEIVIFNLLRKINEGLNFSDIKKNREEYSQGTIHSVENLDQLPFLHFDKTEIENYAFVYPLPIYKKIRWGHLISSRGCPHNCIFCSQLMKESYGKKVRFRSPERIVDEIEFLLGQGANIIAFDDENFTTSKKHVYSICNEILKRNLKVKWIIHARIDEVDEELLSALKQSGCILIRMGVESGNKRILKILEKTAAPDSWVKKCQKYIQIAKSKGITVAGLFIVGNPSETKEELFESIEFAIKLNPEILQVAYFTPFPGSKAYNQFKEQLAGSAQKNFYHYNYPSINLSAMTDAELHQAQSIFYKKFLFRLPFIINHIRKYFLFYAFNRNVFKHLIKIRKHL